MTYREGISVIIPVYNEEEILEENILKLRNALKKLEKDFEIILSENGSTDKTKDICKKLSATDKRIRYVLSDEPSFGDAIRRGTELIGYNRFAVLGADLWDLTFIERGIKSNSDVIFGARYLNEGVHRRPVLRKFISRTNTFLVNLMYGTKFNDVNAIKIYKTEIGKKIFKKTRSKGAFVEVEIAVIIKNSGIRYEEIYSSHIETETRHLKYIIKIVINGVYELLANYFRLRRLRI